MLKEQIEVSKVTEQEVKVLKQIGEKTFVDTYASHNTEKNMQSYLDSAFNIQQLISELKSNQCEYYFAKSGVEVVGYLKLNFGEAQTELQDDSSIEIERIYVVKDFQGRRIGNLLIDFTEMRGKEAGLKSIWLGVWEKNPNAIAFYQKMGFETFDKHDFKLGDELQTDLLMKKELDNQ